MMKNNSAYAVAVRKPDGEIAVTRGKCKSLAERSLFFRLPIIRGIVAFVENLSLGMRTLTYSASFYEEEEEKRMDTEESGTDVKERVQMALTLVFAVVLAMLVFVVLPYGLSQLLSRKISSHMALAVIEGVFRIILFVGYVIAISFMNDIHRTLMYHGAEHKTINCIENGLELTVGNVRRQSKHHRRCGTSFLFVVIFLSIFFFMFIHFDNMWLRLISRIVLVPVIAGISYEFIRFTGNTDNKFIGLLCKPGMFFQMLTTREPDNKMIEVAIASVEEIFDWREYQRRCIGARKSMVKLERVHQDKGGKKKSRAEMAEELRNREEANARRANERAKKLMEQERKEVELEKIADEAAKKMEREKKLRRQQQSEEKPENKEKKEDSKEFNLDNLNHYFDGKRSDRQ